MKKEFEIDVCTASQCSFIPFTPVPDGWSGHRAKLVLVEVEKELPWAEREAEA